MECHGSSMECHGSRCLGNSFHRDGLSFLSCDIFSCIGGRPHEMMLEAARLLTDSGRYHCACACEFVEKC